MSPEPDVNLREKTPVKTVKELLERKGQQPIYTTITTEPVSGADRLMRDHKIRSLLVLDAEDRLWGIVTITDIDNKVNLEGRNPAEVKVGEIMTHVENIITVDAGTTLEKCKALMKEHKIRHLPVVEHGDIPVGIISTTDFAFPD